MDALNLITNPHACAKTLDRYAPAVCEGLMGNDITDQAINTCSPPPSDACRCNRVAGDNPSCPRHGAAPTITLTKEDIIGKLQATKQWTNLGTHDIDVIADILISEGLSTTNGRVIWPVTK